MLKDGFSKKGEREHYKNVKKIIKHVMKIVEANPLTPHLPYMKN